MNVSQRFGEDICELVSSRNMRKSDDLEIMCVSYVMTAYIDIFGAFMIHKISHNLNSTSVVTME